MKTVIERIRRKTRGAGDLVDLTEEIADLVGTSSLQTGQVLLFVVGSTCAISTIEYEPALTRDLEEFYEKIVPSRRPYRHDDTWGDANGFSHIRAFFTGPSLTIPFEHGKMTLGTWQQVVLAEFDNRPRDREIVVHITGD